MSSHTPGRRKKPSPRSPFKFLTIVLPLFLLTLYFGTLIVILWPWRYGGLTTDFLVSLPCFVVCLSLFLFVGE